MDNKILISRQAYDKLIELTKQHSPSTKAEVNELYYNEACRVIQARIERWFDCV